MGRLSLKWVDGNTNGVTPEITSNTTFNVDDPTMCTPLSVLSGLASGFCERRAVLSSSFQTGANTSKVWSQTGTSDTEIADRAAIVRNCMNNMAAGTPVDSLFYDGTSAFMLPIGSAAGSNYMTVMDAAISTLITGTSKYVKSGTADAYSFSGLASAAYATAASTALVSSSPTSAIDMPELNGSSLKEQGLPGLPVEWAKERKWMLDELKHTESAGAAEDQIIIKPYIAKNVLSNSETSVVTSCYPLQSMYVSAISNASVSIENYEKNNNIAFASGQPLTDSLDNVDVAYYTRLECVNGWHTTQIRAGGYVYNRDSSLDTSNRNGWKNIDASPSAVYTLKIYEEMINVSNYAYTGRTTTNYYDIDSVTRVLNNQSARVNIYLERAPNNLGGGAFTVPVVDYAAEMEVNPIVYVNGTEIVSENLTTTSYSVAAGGVLILSQGGYVPFADIQSGGSILFSGGSVTKLNIMDGGYMQPQSTGAGFVTFSGLYSSGSEGYSVNYKQSSGWGYLPESDFDSLSVISSVVSGSAAKDVYVTSGGKVTMDASRNLYCVVCSGGSVSVNAATSKLHGPISFVSSGGILRVGNYAKPININILSGGTVFFDSGIDYWYSLHCNLYIHSGGSLIIDGKAILNDNPVVYWRIEEGAYVNITSDAAWNKITYNHPESGDLTFITPYEAQYVADICSSRGSFPNEPLGRFLGDVIVARFNPFNLNYTAGGSSVYLKQGWNEITITDLTPYNSNTDMAASAYAALAGTPNETAGRSAASTTVLAPANVQSNGMLYFTSYTINNAYQATSVGKGSMTTMAGLYACADCNIVNAVRIYAVNYPLGASTKNHYQEFYVRQFP